MHVEPSDAPSAPTETRVDEERHGTLGVGLLVHFLFGNRAAIETVAHNSRRLWWIALLLVVSAGFAREYDGEDLIARPWFVLVPLAVSLPMALALWTLLYGVAAGCGVQNLRYGRGALAFVTCYWLTAPLASLYAVPYERFLGALDATGANLWTLAVVALWRVLLMLRVSMALLGCPLRFTLGPVLLFAAGATLIATAVTPHPVAVMGGIRLSEADEIVAATTFFAQIFSCLAISVCLLCVLAALINRATPKCAAAAFDGATRRLGRSLVTVAVASVLIWAVVLPFTQPEQRLRRSVDMAMSRGDIAGALDIMSAHQPAQFPPHWHPPPRLGRVNARPGLLEVIAHVGSHGAAPWVRQAYKESFRVQHNDLFTFRWMADDECIRIAAMLPELAAAPDIVPLLARGAQQAHDGQARSVEAWHALREIIEFAKTVPPQSQPSTIGE